VRREVVAGDLVVGGCPASENIQRHATAKASGDDRSPTQPCGPKRNHDPADNDKKEQAVDQPLPSVCARLGPRDHHALKAAAMRRLLNEGIDDLLGAAGDDSVEVFECLRWWQRSRPRLDLRPDLLLN